ncbi:MAG: hypothetical protein C5S49_01960 [Candidatus Methanogaster sp.]|nr:MAG: hypothetical protein C5S49_01960 [ANME-2 cluster archaeon]
MAFQLAPRFLVGGVGTGPVSKLRLTAAASVEYIQMPSSAITMSLPPIKFHTPPSYR